MGILSCIAGLGFFWTCVWGGGVGEDAAVPLQFSFDRSPEAEIDAFIPSEHAPPSGEGRLALNIAGSESVQTKASNPEAWPLLGRSFRVVTPSGGPAADAHVRLMRITEAWVGNLLESPFGSAWNWGEHAGRQLHHYRTDVDGKVRVHMGQDVSLVVFEYGELRGYRLLNSQFSASSLVELAEPQPVVFKLIYASGLPCNKRKLELGGRLFGWAPWNVTTDTKGEFRLYNYLAFLRPLLVPVGKSEASTKRVLQLVIPTLGSKPMTVRLDDISPLSGPVVITVPDSGTVEVQLVDSGGVELHSTPIAVDLSIDTGSQRVRKTVFLNREGRGVMPYIASGARVRATLPDYPLAQLGAENSGVMPHVGASASLLKLLLKGTRTPVLTGRFIDSEGVPLAGCKFEARIQAARDGGASTKLRGGVTDGRGRFQLDAAFSPNSISREPQGRELQFFSIQRENEQFASLSKRLSVGEAPGELGDIVCELIRRVPTLVSGKVVDEDGGPVSGAYIQGFQWPLPTGPLALDDASANARRELQPKLKWQATTDAEGTFSISTHAEKQNGGTLVVGARKWGAAPSLRHVFDVGDTDVTLVLRSPGSIEGQVLLPEGENYTDWSVVVARSPGAGVLQGYPNALGGVLEPDQAPRRSALLGASGHFKVSELSLGPYRVSVVTNWPREPVAAFREVLVLPEGSPPDPVLNPYDLRNSLARVPIRVVNEQGQPLPGAVWATGGGESFLDEIPIPGGVGELRLAKLPVHIWVTAQGYLTSELVVQGDPLEVRLAQAPRVTLTLPRDVGFQEGVTLFLSGVWPSDTDVPYIRLDLSDLSFSGGEVSFVPSELIPVTFSFRIRKAASGLFSPHFFLTDDSGGVDLTNAREGSTYELPISQSFLDSRLAEVD